MLTSVSEPSEGRAIALARLARCLLSRTSRGLLLDLARFARLHMMSAAAQLLKNARALHLTLEGLQRPVDSVVFTQDDLWHHVSVEVCPSFPVRRSEERRVGKECRSRW